MTVKVAVTEVHFPLARNQEDFLNALQEGGYIITVNSDTMIYTALHRNSRSELRFQFNDAN